MKHRLIIAAANLRPMSKRGMECGSLLPLSLSGLEEIHRNSNFPRRYNAYKTKDRDEYPYSSTDQTLRKIYD